MHKPNDALSTVPLSASQGRSLTELSASTIQAAIRSATPQDEAEILKRANVCLANFYDPDLDPETKAGMRESFVRALRGFPLWAVHRAFDAWERTMRRRPSPGEIVVLAKHEVEPMTKELARRSREAAEQEAERLRVQSERPSKERAAEILASVGFTPQRMAAVRAAPMARSVDEALQRSDDGAWKETRAMLDADPGVQKAREAE